MRPVTVRGSLQIRRGSRGGVRIVMKQQIFEVLERGKLAFGIGESREGRRGYKGKRGELGSRGGGEGSRATNDGQFWGRGGMICGETMEERVGKKM